ncbi:MAG TPA: nuclease-related domain-containing protein [Thermoleophilaceae bacterium]|jgi:hypothetical protein
MSARPAGHHARREARRLTVWSIAAIGMVLAVLVAVVLASGWSFATVLAIELAAVGAIFAIERLAGPKVDRWVMGARGEERVGALLDELRAEGWVAIHGVDTGRGNIDTFLAGPGGVFTIEVKATEGKLSARRIHPSVLRQAHAQRKWVEQLIQRPVSPLVVYSHAYLLGRGVNHHGGVCILTARMLVGHLRRRKPVLAPDEVRRITRLVAA